MPDLDEALGRVKAQCARCQKPVDDLKVRRFSPAGRYDGGPLDLAFKLIATCHGQQQDLIIDARQNKPSVIERLQFFGDLPPPPPPNRGGADVVYSGEQLMALRSFLWCGVCRRPVDGTITFHADTEGAFVHVTCHDDERRVLLGLVNDAMNGERVAVFEGVDAPMVTRRPIEDPAVRERLAQAAREREEQRQQAVRERLLAKAREQLDQATAPAAEPGRRRIDFDE